LIPDLILGGGPFRIIKSREDTIDSRFDFRKGQFRNIEYSKVLASLSKNITKFDIRDRKYTEDKLSREMKLNLAI
jgi:hypothetical protein